MKNYNFISNSESKKDSTSSESNQTDVLCFNPPRTYFLIIIYFFQFGLFADQPEMDQILTQNLALRLKSIKDDILKELFSLICLVESQNTVNAIAESMNEETGEINRRRQN